MGTLHTNVRSSLMVDGGISITTTFLLLIACASMPISKTGDGHKTIRVTVLCIDMTAIFAS